MNIPVRTNTIVRPRALEGWSLALLGGLILAAAVRVPALGLLALVGFVPLLRAVQQTASVWQAGAYCSVAFVMASCAGYEGLLFESVLGFVSMTLYVAVVFMWPGVVSKLYMQRVGPRGVWVFVCAWMLAEGLSGSLGLLQNFANPIVQIGYSQSHTVLLPLAAVGGVPLVSLIVLLANIALYHIGFNAQLNTNKNSLKVTLGGFVVATLAVLGTAVFCARLYAVPSNALNTQPIAIAQAAPSFQTYDKQQDTWQAILDSHIEYTKATPVESSLTNRLQPTNLGLVLWPEGAVNRYINSSYNSPDIAVVKQKIARALPYQTPILFGAAANVGNKSYNAVFGYNQHTLDLLYTKHLLVPFMEHWATPGQKSGTLIAVNSGTLQLLNTPQDTEAFMLSAAQGILEAFAGVDAFDPYATKNMVYRTPFLVAPFICLESLHPDAIRPRVLEGAHVLYFPINDIWAKNTHVAYMHYLTSIFRAVEFNRTVYHASLYGPSAIISPNGTTLQYLPRGQAGTISAAAVVHNTNTIFAQYGGHIHTVMLTIAALLMIVAFVLNKKEEVV